MGTKVETKEIVRKRRVFHYFCDWCNKDLGSSEEYEDGYIPDPSTVYDANDYLKIMVGDNWYKSNCTCLCQDCLEKYLAQIEDALNKLVIVKEN